MNAARRSLESRLARSFAELVSVPLVDGWPQGLTSWPLFLMMVNKNNACQILYEQVPSTIDPLYLPCLVS